MCCGVGHGRGLDLVWLWLWPAAIALIRPLACEPPYAAGAAQEIATTTTKDKKTVKAKTFFSLNYILVKLIGE